MHAAITWSRMITMQGKLGSVIIRELLRNPSTYATYLITGKGGKCIFKIFLVKLPSLIYVTSRYISSHISFKVRPHTR